jgi:hypothetical protein
MNPQMHQGYPQQGQPQIRQGYPQQGQPQMQQGYPQQMYPQMQQGYPQQGQPQMQQGYPQQGQPQMQQGYPQQGQPQMQQGYPQQMYPQMQQGYSQQMTPQPKKKSSLGLILGIVFGGIFLLVVAGVLFGLALAKVGSGGKPEITAEYFKNHEWYEENSGSYLVLESSKRFKYYRSKDELDDYYYSGTYEFYSGQEAIDYVVNDLSQYGVTRDEIDDLIERNEKYRVSNFVCMVIHNEEQIVDGEDIMEEDVMTPYYGFYLKDGSNEGLDIANMNVGGYYYFTPE